jgi:hypothetical protein
MLNNELNDNINTTNSSSTTSSSDSTIILVSGIVPKFMYSQSNINSYSKSIDSSLSDDSPRNSISIKNSFSNSVSNDKKILNIKKSIDNCFTVENKFKDPELKDIYKEKNELDDLDTSNHTDNTFTSGNNNISEPLIFKKKHKSCFERFFFFLF